MEMNKNIIGENAGKVWRTLNGKHLTWNELAHETGLNDVDLALALGWLAREDKVSFTSYDGILHLEVYHENYY